MKHYTFEVLYEGMAPIRMTFPAETVEEAERKFLEAPFPFGNWPEGEPEIFLVRPYFERIKYWSCEL